MIQSLVHLCVILAVIGVIYWLVSAFLPLPNPFKQVILVIICIVALLFALSILLPMAGLHL